MAETSALSQDTQAQSPDASVAPGTLTTPDGREGQFLRNLVANLASFVVAMAVGLLFTPYLIKNLGMAAYGLFPLTMTLMLYLGFLTLGLNAAVSRFLTIAVERGDNALADRVFNTSLFGSLAAIAVISVPALLLSTRVQWLVRVPSGSEADATWLFAGAVFAFLVTTIAAPFEVASFCRNRFDLRNAVAIAATAARIGLITLLFTLAAPRLWHIGLGLVLASFVSLAGAIYVWRLLLPSLSIRRSSFRRDTLRDLADMGAWSVINQVGVMLYFGTDLLVVNRMLGPDAGGRFAAVQQWSALLRALAAAVGGVFGPSITAYFARGDVDGLIVYCRRSTKFIGLILAAPIGLIAGLSKPLLHVWLGPGYESLAPLMSLMTLSLSVTLAATALFHLRLAPTA